MDDRLINIFIEKNKDKLVVNRDTNGKITSIESSVPEEDLKWVYCKTVKKKFKDYIITSDNDEIAITYRKNNKSNKSSNSNTNNTNTNNNFLSAFTGPRKIRKEKLKSPKFSLGSLKSTFSGIKKIKKNNSAPVISNNNVNLTDTKEAVNKLIENINLLFEESKKDERHKSSKEINNIAVEFEQLKQRYNNGVKTNDYQEIQNVRVKLVGLKGRLQSQVVLMKEVKDTEKVVDTAPHTIVTEPGGKVEEVTKKEEPKKSGPEKIDYWGMVTGAIENPYLPKPKKQEQTETIEASNEQPLVTEQPSGPISIETQESTFINSYFSTTEKFNRLTSLLFDKLGDEYKNVQEVRKHINYVEQTIEDLKNNGTEIEKKDIPKWEKEKEYRLQEMEKANKRVEACYKELEEVEKKYNEYINGRKEYKIPNQYAKEGYITKNMTRREYSDYLKERGLLEQRIELMEKRKQQEERLSAMRKQQIDEMIELKRINDQLSENGESLDTLDKKGKTL